MNDAQRYEAYAAELSQRFESLMEWAMQNWPNPSFPLMESDFTASKREIASILGPKLGDAADAPSPSYGSAPHEPQFNNVNPAPWP
ncbi:MAG: hypothetical protein K0S28_576 [Paucimonas sp.]|jgi:hypothetical protein|nr:hypothetical protein [Paucimonas sp.]